MSVTGTGAGARIGWVAAAAAAFGVIEASVVIYLRALFYPGGFHFPLQPMTPSLVAVECIREAATLLLILATAMLAGRTRWGRWGAFLLMFGVWDIVFYAWLRVAIGWPATLLDWDILFLLPLPWIGPVVAPVLIATVMIVAGTWFMLSEARGTVLRLSWTSSLLGVAATALLLYSFMSDTAATLHGAMPAEYSYILLVAGLLGYAGTLLTIKRTHDASHG